MKKIKNVMLVAALAMAFTGCSKAPDESNGNIPLDGKMIELTISTAKPETLDTRTMVAADGVTPMWCSGDAIGVSVKSEGTHTNHKFTNDAVEARATTTFTGTTAVSDVIYTYYPYSETGVTTDGKAQVVIPAVQNPSATSFDGSADLLVGKPVAMPAEGNLIEGLQFKRIGGFMKVVLEDKTGRLAGEKVKTLSVTADSNLAGKVYLDIVNGELGEIYGEGSKTVTASYTSGREYRIGDENVAAYFGVYPQTLASGTTLTIAATTDNYDVVRAIELSEEVVINAGQITTLTININEENITDKTPDSTIPEDMEEAFPDPKFRAYVLENFDTDGDGKISQDEALAVTQIITHDNGFSKMMSSLEGVQYFVNLEYLDCSYNQLTSLDVSKNTALTYLACVFNVHQLTSLNVSGCTALTSLDCSDNQLTSLDLSNNTELTSLDCSYNQLTSLNVSDCTELTELSCSSNQLTSLNVSDCTALTELDCQINQLTSLDVSQNTALTYLGCSSNQLTSLDVSGCMALTRLNCSYNQLTSLDLSNNTELATLSCSDNPLTSLDLSNNTKLLGLYCYSNQLTSLDLSNNTKLLGLGCYSNQLTSLDLSNNTELYYLDCHANKLTSLDVSKNTALKGLECGSNPLTSLNVSGCTILKVLLCNDNQLTSLDVTHNTELTYLNCSENLLTTLDISQTNINNFQGGTILLDESTWFTPEEAYGLVCAPMDTLKVLYLKTGWSIDGITNNRSEDCIPAHTQIVFISGEGNYGDNGAAGGNFGNNNRYEF